MSIQYSHQSSPAVSYPNISFSSGVSACDNFLHYPRRVMLVVQNKRLEQATNFPRARGCVGFRQRLLHRKRSHHALNRLDNHFLRWRADIRYSVSFETGIASIAIAASTPGLPASDSDAGAEARQLNRAPHVAGIRDEVANWYSGSCRRSTSRRPNQPSSGAHRVHRNNIDRLRSFEGSCRNVVPQQIRQRRRSIDSFIPSRERPCDRGLDNCGRRSQSAARHHASQSAIPPGFW